MNKRETTAVRSALQLARAVILADQHNCMALISEHGYPKAPRKLTAKLRAYTHTLAKIDRAIATLDPANLAIKQYLDQSIVMPAKKAGK